MYTFYTTGSRAFPVFSSIQRSILMRLNLSVFILLMAFLQVKGYNAVAQELTISGNKMTLEHIFKEIKRQTGMNVVYSDRHLDANKTLDVNFRKTDIKEVLDRCFADLPVTYTITENTIVIRREEYATISMPVKQQYNISGRVVDSLGNAIVHATLAVKGHTLFSRTDERGYFSIPNFPRGSTLMVSCLGYVSRELTLDGSQRNVTIVLKASQTSLEEVIVQTGYQSISKRELASAISQVKMEDIMLQSQFSIDQMLAGQIPGLLSIQSSGEPGATPTIRVRGTSSIMGGSAPLWVLDGIILEDPVNIDVSTIGSPDAAYLVGNAIAGINPNDVETITVLKDASATAIYGVRAANGVIVVTTKRGRAGKTRVNYSTNLSVNQRVGYSDLNLMNAGERVRLSQEIIADNDVYPRSPRNLGYEGLLMDYYNSRLSYEEFTSGVQKMVDRNTDWYDLLFRNSLTQNHSLNMSGGNDKTTYYASISASNNQGSAKVSEQKRYSAMFKVDSWLNDRLYTRLQINGSNAKGVGFHGSFNPNQYAYETARTIPAYDDNGDFYFYETGRLMVDPLVFNALNELQTTGQNSDMLNLTAQLNLDYKIVNPLRYRFFGGVDYGSTTTNQWAKEESYYVASLRGTNDAITDVNSDIFKTSPLPWGGLWGSSDQRRKTYTLRNTLEFSQIFDKDHLVSAMAISEIRSIKYDGISGTYYGWQPERGQTISSALSAAYTELNVAPSLTDNVTNYVSWMGSATYAYKDKYTFNANIRADGSNNFGDNPKYRFLPIWSVAGKYTLTNEEFLRGKVHWLHYFAVRGSYGIQGNIDKSSSPDLIVQLGARNSVTGLHEAYFKYLANPDLRWEKTRQSNIGVEFEFFGPTEKRRLPIISGTIDAYYKQGTDIIVERNLSQTLGLDVIKINGGAIDNRGWEGSIRIVPFQTREANIIFQGNFSRNRNKLVSANKDINVSLSDRINGTALVEGEPIGAVYSYRFAGLTPTNGYPLFYSNTGEAYPFLYEQDVDLIHNGSVTPDISGGFSLSGEYKAFHVNFGFQYTLGAVGRLPDFYQSEALHAFDPLINVTKTIGERWRAPGDEQRTQIPVLFNYDEYLKYVSGPEFPFRSGYSPTYGTVLYDRSDIRVAKTNNLRLRNITVGYRIPDKYLRRYSLNSLALSFQAQNLFLLADSKWEGRDPESGGSNTPLPKVYTFGLNIGF